jgi:hypothetical protein
MSLEGILAGKGSSTSLTRYRNAEVYRQDVSHDTFLFELPSAPDPLTLLSRFPTCRAEVVSLAKVLGNGILQVVALCEAPVTR